MSSPERERLAILFHRIGPYHFARLRAIGQIHPTTAIEMSGSDKTYEWDVVVGSAGFQRQTVFPSADVRDYPAATVSQAVTAALAKLRPGMVAISGWSVPESFGALRWCNTNRVPVIVMSESTNWDANRVAGKEWIKQRLIGMCAAALVGGQPHADYLERLGMPRDRVFLGYDAVDNEHFTQRANEVRGQKSHCNGRPALPEKFFLASARFVEKKNLPRLIEAYARYREQARNSELRTPNSELWDLVLLGDGPLRESLNHQLSTLNLQQYVHLPGFKQYDELPNYYGHAGAFVHASTTEQWGLVVNEAMASGLPVLVSNRCGCAQDLVQEGVNGFTFDPLNVEELAGLMSKISAFNFPLSTFGQASRNIVANWGPERFAEGMTQAVGKALSGPLPKASLLDRFVLKLLLLR